MNRTKKKMGVLIATAAAAGAVGIGFALFGMHGYAESGPPQKDMAVDGAARLKLIESVTAALDKHYVFPEKATGMGHQLRTQLRDGDFDSINSAEKFASVLTDTLQRTSQDKHLEVRYFEETIPERLPGQDQSTQEKAAESLMQLRFNYGFANIQRLQGNIGSIELHQFGRPEGAVVRIAAAMALMADTKALILDLRHCDGGDPDTVMLFASYFYDKRTHLNDVYWRDEGRTEERWTTDAVMGKKYGEARKVYILTSEDTFSGCEDFAYALKNNGRATLVGETTGGGGHAGNVQRLGDHFMMFVPSGRPINPVTNTNWEGVGVVPNVKATADKSIDIARIAIMTDLIAKEKDVEWQQKMQRTLDDLK